jgi:hypothetical protein
MFLADDDEIPEGARIGDDEHCSAQT